MPAITDRTRKMLWGRSGGVCSICKQQLFEDDGLSDDPSVLGQECHIVGEENAEKSPRGLDPLPVAERNLFSNLMLLCRDHHKIIDDQPDKYTVGELHRIKNEHLVWVRQTLAFDEQKQQDDEIYAGIADKWSSMSGLDDWDDFTYLIQSGDAPAVKTARYEELEKLHGWLFQRVYPDRHQSLSRAFENFRRVLHDFIKVFSQHIDPDYPAKQYVRTRKFYKIDRWDEELYGRLERQYEEHVKLLNDYSLELTRAANLICDRMRQYVARTYRVREGLMVARTGTWGDGADHTLRVSYQEHEKARDYPYPGLSDFMTARCERDFFYGPVKDE